MSTEKENKVDLQFAAAIKHARKTAGISQPVFAKKFGISKGYVQMLEGGKRTPSQSLRREIERWIAHGDLPKKDNKIKATIEPGNNRQRSKISDQSKRPTQTDPCLIEIVQWMDEYFGEFPHQTPAFSRDMADQWDSFQKFLEKKREGGTVATQPRSKVSNSD